MNSKTLVVGAWLAVAPASPRRSWQVTSDAYVRAFVDVLKDFDYFDLDAEPEK